jgi:D-arabinose 1-dehydrogenase-like Zn-dependent alcohol dehydrogenase
VCAASAAPTCTSPRTDLSKTSAKLHSVTGVSLPTILGHKFAGVVEAIGAEVRSVRPGDRVAIMPQVFCGCCPQCMADRQQTCINLATVGLTCRAHRARRDRQDGFDALLDRDGDQVKILVQT